MVDKAAPSATIRESRPGDKPVLDQLKWLLWDYHHRSNPTIFRSADDILGSEQPGPPPSQKAERTIVAEVDRAVVGHACAVLRDVPAMFVFKPQRRVVLQEIAVFPEWRNIGLGRRLLEDVKGWAADNKAEVIEIPVLAFNQEALALYRALGFGDYFLQLRLTTGL